MGKVSRQLATIMFSDIVGYSRMMAQDEGKAIQLRQKVEVVIKELVPKFDGEIIQFYGDGALTMFDSNVEAIQCALLIQKKLSQLNGIHLRIGIHGGDVAIESGQVYGECVNIASRIESFCTPGAVMFSDRVQEDLENKSDIDCVDLGEYKLKNIPRPIRLFALNHQDIHVPTRLELEGKGERSQKSIAVLPFVNMSADIENEYFSDGISEEILNTLSKEDTLRVTARTSSFAYKGRNLDIREIGKELNVEYVLEGSVRKSGNRVRITAQLIRASEGFHVLSETYDKTLHDIFAVQDEIAHRITNQLRLRLGLNHQAEVIHQEPTENLDAYQDYLKGVFYWSKYDAENAQKATEFLYAAIEKDPNFAEPHALLSFCYSFLGGTGQMISARAFPLAKDHAEKALAINPKLVEAFCAKGLVYVFQEWDLVKAEECFHLAKAINRQSDAYFYTYSLFLKAAGRFVEAVEVLEEAIQIDPVNVISNAYLAEAYASNFQFEKAMEQLERMDELFPTMTYNRVLRIWFLTFQGQHQQALKIAREKLPDSDPLFKEIVALRGMLWGLTGNQERALACEARMNQLTELDENRDYRYLYVCIAYGLNDKETLSKYIHQAAVSDKGGLIMAFSDPFWKKVFEDLSLNEELELIKKNINR